MMRRTHAAPTASGATETSYATTSGSSSSFSERRDCERRLNPVVVFDANGGATTTSDAWRASKRRRVDETMESIPSSSSSSSSCSGGGITLSPSSLSPTTVHWSVDPAFAPDACVVRGSNGEALRIVAPSALRPNACAIIATKDGKGVIVMVCTLSMMFTVRIRDVNDFSKVDAERDARSGAPPSCCARKIECAGGCGGGGDHSGGTEAFVLGGSTGAAVIVHADTLKPLCELHSSALSRVWNTIKGGEGGCAVVDVTRQSISIGTGRRQEIIATLASDGFVQVWDVTNVLTSAQNAATNVKATRVCGAHVPPPPGTESAAGAASAPRYALAFAVAPSGATPRGSGCLLNLVVSSRLAPTEENPEASKPGDAELAFYTIKSNGVLSYGSSIEGSRGVTRALALTNTHVYAAIEHVVGGVADDSSVNSVLCWPLDGLHRAREVRSGDVEVAELTEWGHSGRGNAAAVEMMKRFGALNGYTAASVARALTKEIDARGAASEEALDHVRHVFNVSVDEQCGSSTLNNSASATADVVLAVASSSSSCQTPSVARVVQAWCRVAPEYARGWRRAHEPLSFIVDDRHTGAILVRSGGLLGVMRANEDVEESLLRAKITNEDSPMLKFNVTGRQAVAALTALFSRLNGVLGSSACTAMDLIASGIPTDTSTSNKSTAFDNHDERVEALSHNAQDWLESFSGALIGDVFPLVPSSDEEETQVKSRRASHRAKQRLIIRLLQDALGAIPNPAEALEACVDSWRLDPVVDSPAGANDKEEESPGGESPRSALTLNAARQQIQARLAASRGMILLLGCVRLGPKVGFPVDAVESVMDVLPKAMHAYRTSILSSWLLTDRRRFAAGASLQSRGCEPRLATVLTYADADASSQTLGAAALVSARRVAAGDASLGSENSSPPRVRRVVEIGTALYAAGEVEALGALLAFARQQVPGEESCIDNDSEAPALLFLQALWVCADLAGLNDVDEIEKFSRSVDSAVALFSRAAAFIPEFDSSAGSSSQAVPTDALLVQLLRVIRDILVGCEEVFPQNVVTRLEYYEIVMLFFERLGCATGAAAAAYAALHEVRDDENQSARLWANVLQYAVDARDWRAAYCAATSTAGDHRQAAAMRRLVASACEPGAKNGGAVLSTLCLDDTTDGSHYETIVNALEGRAATAPITPHAAPSDILYGFYLSRGKPANAAVAMYDFAARLRLRVSEVVRDPAMTYEELVAALARHSSALLASANALATLSDPCLVNFDKTPEDEVMEGNEDLSTVNVVSSGLDTKKSPLAEVLRAHALSAARLELLHAGCEIRALCLLNGDDQGDQGDASSVPSVCDSLIEYGCFQAATTLSTAWLNGEKLTSKLAVIAGTMAARAALAQIGDPSAADDAPYRKWQTVATEARGTKGLIGVDAPASSVDVYWNELRAFVERFDTLERNFAIAEASARAVLAVDARIALPKWLVERFINTPCLFSGGGMGRRGANPAALLRVYLSFDLVEDAARLALRELSTWSRRSAVDRTAHSAVWFPMDLMLEARDRCARDERLEHLRLALTTAIESHESRLKADTAMLTQVSA
jgi:hypothetical protein